MEARGRIKVRGGDLVAQERQISPVVAAPPVPRSQKVDVNCRRGRRFWMPVCPSSSPFNPLSDDLGIKLGRSLPSADARVTRSPARRLASPPYIQTDCRSPISRPRSPPVLQLRNSFRREVSGVINFPLPSRPYDWLPQPVTAPSFPD